MKNRYVKVPVFLILGILVVGLFISMDYGVSWDESNNSAFGQRALVRIGQFFSDVPLEEPQWTDEHGPIFEVILITIEGTVAHYVPDITSRQTVFVRHFSIFSFWVMGLFGFYLLTRNIWRDSILPSVGILLLATHPRLFAHSFFNSYDIGFTVATIWSFWSLWNFVHSPRIMTAFIHGVICAFATDIRIVGVLFPVATISVVLLQEGMRFWRGTEAPSGAASSKRVLTFLAVYLVAYALFVVLFWPFLWADPLERFMWVFQSMSQIEWPLSARYLGQSFPNGFVPWHYNFVWIVITTPLFYLGLILLALPAVILTLCRKEQRSPQKNLALLLVTFWLVVPLVAPLVLHSALFDGWRHHFFQYPAWVLLMLFALDFVRSHINTPVGKRFRVPVLMCLGLGILEVGHALWAYHPHQNVFFNSLVRSRQNLTERFDVDYWGTSYRQALEYIVQNDTRQHINVMPLNPPGRYNTRILSPEQQRRIRIVNNLQSADYFVSNFRDGRVSYPYGHEVFHVTVSGIKIMTVVRIAPSSPTSRHGP